MKRPIVRSCLSTESSRPCRTCTSGAQGQLEAARWRERMRTHLVVVRASDGGRRLGAVPLPGRAVVDHGRRLRVLPAPDSLKDRLLVRDELAKAGACVKEGEGASVTRFSQQEGARARGLARRRRRGARCEGRERELDAPFSILSLTSSIAVLASSSESCPPTVPSSALATAAWISFLSHFCASHLSDALNGGPRGCW